MAMITFYEGDNDSIISVQTFKETEKGRAITEAKKQFPHYSFHTEPVVVASTANSENRNEFVLVGTKTPALTPMAGQNKKETGKIRMSLIPPSLMIEVGKCITFGADKYSDYGWKDVDDSLYKDALLRHLMAWLEDEDSIDSETGYSHLSHAACNIAFLIEKKRMESEEEREVIREISKHIYS